MNGSLRNGPRRWEGKPMTDAGDDAAAASARLAKEAARAFLRTLGASARHAGPRRASDPTLSERASGFAQRLREDAPGQGGPEPGSVPSATLCAPSAEEAAGLAAKLEAAGIERYAGPGAPRAEDRLGARRLAAADFEAIGRNEAGLYEITAPDRASAAAIRAPFSDSELDLVKSREGYTLLRDAPESVRALIERNSPGRVADRLALEAALAEASRTRAHGPLPGGELGSFSFETVSWDERADIVAGALSELGVPFERTVGDERVSFSVPIACAAEVDEVRDALARFARVDPSRWDLSGLPSDADEPTRLVFATPAPLDPEAARMARAALEGENVRYEAWTDRETGGTVIAVDGRELADRGFADKVARAQTALAAMPGAPGPPAASLESMERARSRAAEQTRRIGEARRRRAPSKATPASDERAARRSASAQMTDREARERPISRGR